MNVLKPLRSPRFLAALAALALPLLTGCATGRLLGEERPHEMFVKLSDAYLGPDELGIEYITRGNREHYWIAWFQLAKLRKGAELTPYVAGPENRPVWRKTSDFQPDRREQTRGLTPEGAKSLPLHRGVQSLPPGADLAVFVPPKGQELAHGYYGDNVAIVVLLCEDGRPYTLRLELPTPSYEPWLNYVLAPVAIPVAVVTLPFVFLMLFFID